MIISALAFTFLNVFVKSLHSFSVYQIVFFRATGSLFFTIPFLLKNKIPILGNKKGLLISRSVFGLISMSLFFLSIKHITMGTAVSIRYISPVFAAIFALFYLKEKISPKQWVFLAMAFSGVIILKGFDAQSDILGITYAIASAIFAGLVYITIRKIGKDDHPVVIVNYFMIISAVICGLLTINHWTNPTPQQWLILASLGVFGYFAQLYMTKAMQLGELNIVAPLKYLEVVFTVIFGLLWFNEIYTVFNVIGILIIILGLVLNLLSKK